VYINRLLKNAHLLRCPRPSSLRRTYLYDSLLGISVALYLDVFEQPAKTRLFSILLTTSCLSFARALADAIVSVLTALKPPDRIISVLPLTPASPQDWGRGKNDGLMLAEN